MDDRPSMAMTNDPIALSPPKPKPIINAAGTMTWLGASRMIPDALEAATDMAGRFVDIDSLQLVASRAIARATGAEAGCITGCSAAGLSLSVAGAMTGANLARIERLPDVDGLKDEVVVQAGHLVNYGAPIAQAIRLTGAKVIAAGSAARVEEYNIADAIGERTAAIVFVISHHVVQEGQTPLADVVALARAHGVPVIVDAAAEYDLEGPIKAGADLTVWSSHKFLGGPTAGIVAGTRERVKATYLQNRGLGRHMKVGKEGIAGTIAALEAWSRRDHDAVAERECALLDDWEGALEELQGLTLSRHKDWTGNPVVRLKIDVGPDSGLYAWELADRLAARNPAIIVRDDLVEHGTIYLDPCNLSEAEGAIVSSALRAEVERACRKGDGRVMTLAARRRAKAEAARAWGDPVLL
ncbi:aminotransferase class V-fold PLP-dependent enzyme [Acuticoccus sp. M5D2P5]|uniref:aminotransferase class V-fold PLP-dependent enzyme n=1 Tax=Acuticoccus kalidii TaxID=2910977 RepID=UPI001F30D662|nr:aminotransferase class V-fold PLP-dependent enzyme [Acuticoccus kalidii]MCF3934755.1 aminotransferase class V-fold PLP-dependent enzyme [Acuticoccus kalidii]